MDPPALPNVATGMPHSETLTAKGGVLVMHRSAIVRR